MKLRKIALGVLPLAAAGALALGGVAHAGVNYSNVRYTNASVAEVAGYEAVSNQGDLFQFTHLEANTGVNSAGVAKLPAVAASTFPNQGGAEDDTTHVLTNLQRTAILGGGGIELCSTDVANSNDAVTAEIGLVNIGSGKMDVIAAAGAFNTAFFANGDKCENGLATKGFISAGVLLLSNVPINHAVNVGLLYTKGGSGYQYTHNGHSHHQAGGTATAYATDDMASTFTSFYTVPGVPAGINFNDASAGVVADNATSTALSEPIPDPSTASTPNRLFTFAHVKVNGNSEVSGTHEIEGAFQTGAAWSVYPVANTSDGTATGLLFLNPHQFFDDHFDVDAGSTVITPAA